MNISRSNFYNFIKKKTKDRIFVIRFSFLVLFFILLIRLFFMQVLSGDKYLEMAKNNVIRKINLNASRGLILDRNNEYIARNKFIYNVKFDASIKSVDVNLTLFNLIKLLEENGDKYIDNLPITKNEPFEFTFENENEKKKWFEDMNMKKNNSNLDNAQETFNYLKDFFNIDSNLSNQDIRKIINLKSILYKQRYRLYDPITIAIDINDKSYVSIEEDREKFAGIYVDKESIRDYQNARCFANIIGYLGKINDEELENNKNYNADNLIGKTGIEKSFEKDLKGTDGELIMEVNSLGRREKILDKKNAIQGNNIFLTIDKNLQVKSYEILEDILINSIKAKLENKILNLNELLASMIKTNVISLREIFSSDENTYSNEVKKYILNKDKNLDFKKQTDQKKIRNLIYDAIKNNFLGAKLILLILREQNIITGDMSYFKNNNSNEIFFDKLNSHEIAPDMLICDPNSASIVIIDVNNGDVLTAVSYPSFDNNKIFNFINNDYFNQMLTAENTPMVNRPFMEPRAPGSTFKMLTGIAALETNAIQPNTKISDNTIFKKVGIPYSKCWSKISHGNIDITQALEVSCNYFFFESAYRMGNRASKSSLNGINKLNFYMREFGFDDRTGVEIGELYDFSKNYISNISGPDYHKKKDDKNKIWYDGDTIRTAIGQSKNNYTAANMAKYVSIVASRGKRYKLKLIDKIQSSSQEKNIIQKKTVLEKEIDIKNSTWDAIYRGMELVVSGDHGTARTIFKDCKTKLAAKTGTAQENNSRPSHSSFCVFAPIQKPKIAVYIVIPFGETKAYHSPASKIARKIIDYYFSEEELKES
ncbi:MAG: hypothetical protein LBJ93_00710 [Clostridiales bacterium]|nr:hypothetical protein [Clostridiales bacterium]